ncbi:MAG: UDP-N-acetylmuramoyl-L-alanyl-D-glutamate--2,6-diaminopimelate ligase [Burkholderiales bacterium]|jgi:UDP-N-acetylmuramoyl-L-alanyl-D-glutamate--2,6-diaminopimelate ligase|nr:UDP-N-acetylmuramoyl-L-alanyl-D-glutamate--2,6-diaminopimelate ligase [Burkholderiales bacterium]
MMLRAPFTSAFSLKALIAWLAQFPTPPKGITVDSRQVKPGMLFAALPGTQHDGRRFIAEAIARGAVGILWEAGDRKTGDDETNAITVPHWGIGGLAPSLGIVADAVYGQPSRHLPLIGVTGTNGKTSCAHWIAQALHARGSRTGVIGTLGHGLVEEKAWLPSLNTTPDAASLQNVLVQLRKQGAEAVVMEVSSIGLEQGRVNGCCFDTALFTNLTRDHLDYHGTFEAYAAAKTRLFAWPQLRHAVINLDDPMSGVMVTAARLRHAKVWRYSSSGHPNAEIAVTDGGSVREMCFTVRTPQGEGEVRTSLLGEFNRANVLGVLGVLLARDVPLPEALQLLSTLTSPPGRLQRMGHEGQPVVVIDYAHTPDALDNVLRTLRATQTEGRQLFCVFGCGGDRDAGKRPLMGAVAAKRADRVWITNDNPRNEPPTNILVAIEKGLRSVNGASWVVEADRAAAIAQAVAAARAGDLVLIAGKGHEPYQEIAGARYPFLDADVATQALNKWSAS